MRTLLKSSPKRGSKNARALASSGWPGERSTWCTIGGAKPGCVLSAARDCRCCSALCLLYSPAAPEPPQAQCLRRVPKDACVAGRSGAVSFLNTCSRVVIWLICSSLLRLLLFRALLRWVRRLVLAAIPGSLFHARHLGRAQSLWLFESRQLPRIPLLNGEAR